MDSGADDTGSEESDDSDCLDDEDCWEDDTETEGDDDDDMDTDTDPCSGSGVLEEIYDVPEPPIGVEPDAQTLCEWNTDAVESNRAARVTFTPYSQSIYLATGQVEVAADLRNRVIGVPDIRVVQAFPEDLLNAEVTDIQPSNTGFAFHIAFPQTAHYEAGETEMSLQVTLELDCTDFGDDTKMVESTTFVHLCEGGDDVVWVSSGDECTICYEICEMAPCPIPASPDGQLSVLPGSPKVEIVPVAGQGRMVVLFAEHRGTQGPISYCWRASGGTLSGENRSGVIWQLPADSGPHLLQVAVKDTHSAAVAAVRWQHKA
jgi:hypothetical protein